MSPRVPALALALMVQAGQAWSGILIEARLEGVPIRLELASRGEPGGGLVAASVDGSERLVELERGLVRGPDGAPRPPRPGTAGPGPGLVSLTPLGGGAMVAGHGGAWQLLTEDGRICAEVLASAWMLRFLEPAIRALELLQAVEPALAPRPRHGCSALGFASWTAQGWPLLVSGRSDTLFQTERIRFDHRPAAPAAAEAPAGR